MELRDYLRILHKSWAWIVVATVLGTGFATAASLATTPEYESRTQLYVSVRSDSTGTGELVQGTNFARQIVGSYVDIVRTGLVLEPVVEELGLDMSASELAAKISSASPLNSVLINITATDEDPARAALIANAVGESFKNAVQTELEPDADGVRSLVNLTTTQEALPNESPVSPNLKMNIALGLLVGLAAGVGFALLRSILDTRVHSLNDIENLTELPVLGGIAYDPDTDAHPLIVHEDPLNPRAEAYRTMRTNLQFIDVANTGHKAFVVTSAGPSEGKSTTSANLAIALAETGSKVVLIEGDLRKPKVASYMGLESGAGLTDVLIGRAYIDEVLQRWGRTQLHVLPAGRIPPNPSELLGSFAMDQVLTYLNDQFDVVLIDAPPTLLVTDAAVLGSKTAGLLVVVAAGRTKKQAIEATLRSLETANARALGMIATMLPTKGPDSYTYGSYAYGYVYEHKPEKGKNKGRKSHARRAATKGKK